LSQINDMLKLKTWAVVGATKNHDKFGFKIFKCMLEAGYTVYPVNPGVDEILGHKCYPSLKELPITPEAVDLVVPPRIGQDVLQECSSRGIKNVWLQPGADSKELIHLGKQLGLNLVHNACVMVEIRNGGIGIN